MKERVEAHLKRLVMETIYSHIATMPIPLYEQTKQLIKDLYAANQALTVKCKAYETLKKSMDDSEPSYRRQYYALRTEFEKLEPLVKTLESECEMNKELTAENQEQEAEIKRLRGYLSDIHSKCFSLRGSQEFAPYTYKTNAIEEIAKQALGEG